MKTPQVLLVQVGDVLRKLEELPQTARPFSFLFEIGGSTMTQEEMNSVMKAFRLSSIRHRGPMSLNTSRDRAQFLEIFLP
ncbi:MAG: hypothetical protein WCV55_01130 [Candidatus Paceibacterota bacterium]